MKQYLWIGLIAVLSACDQAQSPQASQIPTPQLKTVAIDPAKLITGQTVYVPIYSHIYMVEANRRMNLTATLSIRNTDLSQSMIVTAVNYYNTNGELVRKYLEQSIGLKPLSATEFVVAQEDVSGGAGASFIVEWGAQKTVSAPVIEAVMINSAGNQGVSFVSAGRVIKTRTNSK